MMIEMLPMAEMTFQKVHLFTSVAMDFDIFRKVVMWSVMWSTINDMVCIFVAAMNNLKIVWWLRFIFKCKLMK